MILTHILYKHKWGTESQVHYICQLRLGTFISAASTNSLFDCKTEDKENAACSSIGGVLHYIFFVTDPQMRLRG